jgi:hypothetical protein
VDFLDFIAAFPVGLPGEPSRGRTTEENITGAVGLGVLPAIDFLIVLLANLYEHPFVAMLLLPAVFTLATVLLCKRLETSTGWTVTAGLGCSLLCLVASGAAFLLGLFFSFFSAF